MVKKFFSFILLFFGLLLFLISLIGFVSDIFSGNVFYPLIDILFLTIGGIIFKIGYDLRERVEEKRETGIEPILISLGRLYLEMDELKRTVTSIDRRIMEVERFTKIGVSAFFQKVLLAAIVSLGILMIVVIHTTLEMIFFVNFLYFVWWFLISEHFKLLNDVRSYIWIIAIIFVSPILVMIFVAILGIDLLMVALFQYILLSLYTFLYYIYAYNLRYGKIPFFEKYTGGEK